MAVSNLAVNITGNASGLNSVISGLSSSLGSLAGGPLALVGGALAAAGAAAIGFGAVSVKAAGDFQSQITSLSTGAGELQSNLKMIGDGILSLSTSTGTSTKQLTDGMYMIESAGYHGSAALDVLKAAAEGAKVGNADLGAVANGVTTMLTDYAGTGLTASQATNTLVAAVSQGKTHMQDLATAMSTILPTASAAHVSLTDTAGALATMTGEGTSAAAASTYLRQTIMSLENPSTKSSAALQSIGLSSQQVSSEMQKSLPGALQMITDHLKSKFPEGSAAYVKALADISGGSKQMQGMLELTGQHLDTFKKNVEGIGDAVKKGGAGIQGWAQVQGDFNQKISQMQQGLNAIMITVGKALLPFLSGLLDKINPIIGAFNDWLTKGNGVQGSLSAVGGAVAPLGKAIGDLFTALGPVIKQFIDWAAKNDIAGKAGNALKGVIADIAAGIEFAIPYIVDIAKNILQFAEDVYTRVKPVIEEFMVWWDANWPAIAQVLKGVWDMIVGVIKVAWALVSGIIKIGLDILSGNWQQAWNDLVDMVKGIWGGFNQWIGGAADALVGVIKLAGAKIYDWLTAPFLSAFNDIKNAWNSVVGLFGGGGGTPQGNIPGYASGVENFRGGWALVGENGPELLKLPTGSSVYPRLATSASTIAATARASSPGSTTGDMTFVWQVDSQEMSRVLVPGVAAGLQKTVYLRTGVR